MPRRPEPVGQSGTHRGRWCEDAGAIGQAVAVQGKAERAFAEHDRRGGVTRVSPGFDLAGIPHACRGVGMNLHPEEAGTASPLARALTKQRQQPARQRPRWRERHPSRQRLRRGGERSGGNRPGRAGAEAGHLPVAEPTAIRPVLQGV